MWLKSSVLAGGLVILMVFLSTCTSKEKPELLIYCGITMIEPMNSIASQFEKEHDCIIEIVKGGTGTLLESIRTHQNGDLFLPGSADYYNQMNRHEFSDTAKLGQNLAVLMVEKGNPKQIKHINQLTDSTLRIIVSNSNSGSIGIETKQILDRFGNYEQVLANAKLITSDSKDLTRLLLDKQADVAINWAAEAFKNGHDKKLDVVYIESKFTHSTPIILCVLKNSKNKALSTEFLKFASSEYGKKIFNQHGF